MKISALILTRNRAAPLLRCLDSVARQRLTPHEVLVLDDASDQLDVSEVVREAGHGGVRVMRSDRPLGVAGGRNRLFREASGDVFFFLDDDAFLDGPECLDRLVAVLRERPKAGIVATRIVDHTFPTPRLLVPFPKRTRVASPELLDRAQPVSYFLGGGHAVRREVYDRVGGYHESLVWGEEELELSYRAIEAGYEIFYAPNIVVQHYPNPPVLLSAERPRAKIYYHVQNRLLLARMFLPARYIGPYLAIWLARYFATALRDGTTRDYFGGLSAGVRTSGGLSRSPLTPRSLEYLRRNHGRVWY